MIAKIYTARKESGYKFELAIHATQFAYSPMARHYFNSKKEARAKAVKLNAAAWNY